METSKRNKPKFGDVIEFVTGHGLAYAQFTHKDPMYGSLIRILPGFYSQRPDAFNHLVQEQERFFTFFPLGAAMNKGIVKIVSSEEIPQSAKTFPLMRVAGGRDRSGRVTDWWLWDGKNRWKVGVLTKEQQKLSIAGVWNDTLLVQRIEEEWVPSREV